MILPCTRTSTTPASRSVGGSRHYSMIACLVSIATVIISRSSTVTLRILALGVAARSRPSSCLLRFLTIFRMTGLHPDAVH